MKTTFVTLPVRYISTLAAEVITDGAAPDAWAVYRREPVSTGGTEDRWVADFGRQDHARAYARACQSALFNLPA